jgi:hypothetical protein
MIDQQGKIHYGRLFGLFLIILVSIYGITSINIYTSPVIFQGLFLCLISLLMFQSIVLIHQLTIETLKYAKSLRLIPKITFIHLDIKQDFPMIIDFSEPFIPKIITQWVVIRI